MNLRKKARGQECFVRIPRVCNFDPETTVLAHIRRGGVAGIGQKPPDICGVACCSACHDVIDARNKVGFAQIDGYILEGLNRWLAHCWREGWIK